MLNKLLNKIVRLVPVQYKDLGAEIKGRSYGLFIQISPRFKDDKGLLAHERVHARQMFKTWLVLILLGIIVGYFTADLIGILIGIFGQSVHNTLYKFSKTYKYKCEVEAFGYSVLYGNRSKDNVERSLKGFYKIPDKVMKDFDKDFLKAMENAKEDLEELKR